jgi:hypothetical protein
MALIIAFTAFFITICLYFVTGVFISYINYDELYFLSSAWGISQTGGDLFKAYQPPLFPFLISKVFTLFSGDLVAIYALRLLSFLVTVATSVLLYIYIGSTIHWTSAKKSALAAIISSSIIVYICAVRGAEIRPEGLGNLLFLLSCCCLLCSNYKTPRNVLLPISIVASYLAASCSFRLTGAALFMCIAGFFKYLQFEKPDTRVYLLKTCTFIGIVFFLLVFNNWVMYPLNELLQSSIGVVDHRDRLSYIDKLTRLGVFRGHTDLLQFARIALTFQVVAYTLIAIGIQIRKKTKIEVMQSICVLASIITFYILLYIEKKPFDYIVSCEAIILTTAFIYAYKIVPARLNKIVALFIFFQLSIIASKSVWFLHHTKNTRQAISNTTQRMDDRVTWANMPTKRLHAFLGTSEVLIDQIRMRNVLCERFEDSFVVVNSYRSHPICIGDEYSADIVREKDIVRGKDIEEINIQLSVHYQNIKRFITPQGPVLYYK